MKNEDETLSEPFHKGTRIAPDAREAPHQFFILHFEFCILHSSNNRVSALSAG